MAYESRLRRPHLDSTSKDPKANSLAKMTTVRTVSMVGSSVYRSDRWLDQFFHSGRWWLGNWVMRWFWGYMTKIVQGGKYWKSENGEEVETSNGQHVLARPWRGILLVITRGLYRSFGGCGGGKEKEWSNLFIPL